MCGVCGVCAVIKPTWGNPLLPTNKQVVSAFGAMENILAGAHQVSQNNSAALVRWLRSMLIEKYADATWICSVHALALGSELPLLPEFGQQYAPSLLSALFCPHFPTQTVRHSSPCRLLHRCPSTTCCVAREGRGHEHGKAASTLPTRDERRNLLTEGFG